MAEIGFGYGSEYQLLRYLGHHRNFLFSEIMKVTHSYEPIEWLDYPVNLSRLSKDGELKGIECFRLESNFCEISTAWKSFWPQSGNAQNWDGIFKQGDTWYFVEAKANKDEIHQRCGAGDRSRQIIIEAFKKIMSYKLPQIGDIEEKAKEWVDSNSYQLANRIAFVVFCEMHNIKARLLYINFINGYDINDSINVKDQDGWEKEWQDEYQSLSITDSSDKVLCKELQNILLHVYIDCHKPEQDTDYE